MWRLHRYYLKELAIDAGITFVVMFAIVLVSTVYRAIQRAQGGGLLDVVLIIVFMTLDAFPHLLTIAFLLATVLTFTRAAQDRELIAIRAAGVSPRVPMTAALLVGIALSVLGSFALHYVIPEVHYRKYRVIPDIARNLVIGFGLGSDRIQIPRFGKDDRAATDFVMTFDRQSGGEYHACTIYGPKPLPGLRSPIVHVDRVSIPPVDETTDLLSIVLSGVRDPLHGASPGQVRLTFSARDLVGSRRREDSGDDLRSDQLLAEVMRGLQPESHEAVYTLFRRCCFALMPALLAPIGFCLAEFARERGRVFALAACLVPLALFYLGEVLGARLLLSTRNPWCGWLPIVLLALVGVPLCWRQLRR